MAEPLMTAEEYAEAKYDLPEGGRWTELERGRIVTLQPPDEAHGNVVGNLSRALGTYFGERQAQGAYACFDLGLLVAREPDTVRSPAVCCFPGPDLFSEADKIFSDVRPILIVEIASTNDRRRSMPGRVEEYRAWGVDLLWVIDTANEQVHVYPRERSSKVVDLRHSLLGEGALPGFGLPVAKLFIEPEWYRGR